MRMPIHIGVDNNGQTLSCSKCGAFGGAFIWVYTEKRWKRRVEKFLATHVDADGSDCPVRKRRTEKRKVTPC